MNNTKKLIYLLITTCLFISKSTAQIGINATGDVPASNAMLDISSTTKGLLIPRMKTDQRTLLTATATDGLTVYDTDTKGYWFYNGTSWQSMSGGGGGGSSQWTTNGSNIYFNTGNVGIGQANPGMPLNFANTSGDKISLWGQSGNHYGFGIQNGLLQIHTDGSASNIAFGFGSSASFTERMRIFNTGADGSVLNGRLLIKNGTADINNGGGVWLYKADNSALLAFMGTMNNQNVGFYGGPVNGGWGFTYNGLNSRVGIGNSNPNAPLAFGASLEKKITLYPGATGDVGFAVGGNQLKIYADNPNAQVSIGYDAAGVFTDRFSVKANGALAVNGNMGNGGQVLKSNGANTPPTWANKATAFGFTQSGQVIITGTDNESGIPGLDFQSFSINETSNVVFSANISVFDGSLLYASYVYILVQLLDGGNNVVGSAKAYGALASLRRNNINPTGIATLAPGFYTTRVVIGRDGNFDGNGKVEGGATLIFQVYPQ